VFAIVIIYSFDLTVATINPAALSGGSARSFTLPVWSLAGDIGLSRFERTNKKQSHHLRCGVTDHELLDSPAL
jgi:hypothetical protein